MYAYVMAEMEFKQFYLDKNYVQFLWHLRFHKYNVIWCENSGSGLVTVLCKMILKDRLSNTKIVTRFHRVPSMLLEEKGWKALVPLFGSDVIVWVYDCKSELEKLLPTLNTQNFFAVHNGVDLNFYKNLGKTRESSLVVTLSNWWQHKRLELLIEAMQYLPKHELVVAGNFLNTSYKQYCQKLAKDKTNVFFMGYADQKEKRELFNKASIFVLPSKSEAWSTHVMEAMACESPVLITEGGGPNEFVPEQELLRQQVTSKELAEKIEQTSKDKELGQLNREHVKPYSWNNISLEVRKVLDSIK
jgi:glycosyltransferase involved in cell wall biosynthesis